MTPPLAVLRSHWRLAFARGELGFFGNLAPLADPAAFARRLRALAYLARYAHRTAIGNSRLVDVTDAEAVH